jgi:iron complex outermembrane receptor protein
MSSIRRMGVITGLTASSLFALSMSTAAFAQTDENAPEADAQASEIVVTGSRIRGVTAGGSVVAVGQAQIQTSPAASATELLREVPQVVNLGADESHKGGQGAALNTAFASGVNLRGIGGSTTLLLLNGRRVVPSGVQGQYTDPSIIPSIALERMEVIADGASAIYGSDAVAGVVNLITRSKFEGAETRARYGFADGTDRLQVSHIFGGGWDTGHAVLAFEYLQRSKLAGSDRSFYREDLRDFGGRDYRANMCNPGTLVAGGQTYALGSGALVAGTQNRCDALEEAWLLPNQERFTAFGNIQQSLGDGVTLNLQSSLSVRKFDVTSGSRTAAITVRNTNPYFTTPVSGGTSVVVNYMLPKEFGYERSRGTAQVFETVLGLDLELWGDWRANVAGVYGHSEDRIYGLNRVNATNIAISGASSNPALAINPFGTGVNAASVYDFIRGRTLQTPSTTMVMGEAQADGSLFNLPGGAVRLAVGAEARREMLKTRVITYTPGVLPDDRPGRLARTIKSAYGELFVPIFSASNAIPGFQRLDVSIAYRHDHYDDFGSTTNPKYSVNWKPVRDLTLRASYGESFRAPNMAELDVSTIAVQQRTRIDPLASSGTSTGVLLSGGNPNLAPETAKTWTAGFDLNPSFVPGLAISATYFNVDYRDQVLDLFAVSDVLVQETAYAAFITRNPTAAEINNLLATYRATSAVNPLNNAFYIDARRQNLGITKVDGFDITARYDFNAFGGNMYLSTTGTLFTSYDTSAAPGAGVADRLNTINYPVDKAFRADLGWSNQSWRTRVSASYTGGYTNTTSTPVQEVGSYISADAYIGYKFGAQSGAFKDLTLSLDVQNVFDRKPNFVNIPGGYDGEKASAIGRFMSIGLTKSW